tara:strand:+ start:1134 stop:1790 length:657 start_codon:yes stop_codon:yes gene_type:complete
MRFIRLSTFLTFFVLVSPKASEEMPQPVTETDFKALSMLSPFSRPIDLSETLSLTGLARIGEQSLITLMDQNSEKSHVVSGKANNEGWKLIEVSAGVDYDSENTFANIAVPGGEIVELRFDGERLDPDSMRKRAAGINGGYGRDNRPPPSKEEREKWGKYIKARMSKLTETQRKEIGQRMGQRMKEIGGKLSDRQKGDVFIRILDDVDKQGSSIPRPR